MPLPHPLQHAQPSHHHALEHPHPANHGSSSLPPRGVLSLPGSPNRAIREILPHSPSSVVRLSNLRSTPTELVWNLFSHGCSQLNLHSPSPVLPNLETNASSESDIWAVFISPSHARAALSLSCDIFSVSPAPELELAYLPTVKRVTSSPLERESPNFRVNALAPAHMTSSVHFSGISSFPQSRAISQAPSNDPSGNGVPSYTISSNPPNPKTSFRVGDWMCSAANCSAHNFQRNTVCIACGRLRTGTASSTLPVAPSLLPAFPLAAPSPRFAGRFNASQGNLPLSSPVSAGPAAPNYPLSPISSAISAAQAQMSPKPPPPQYPSLTPSGRTLSVGGRVRNVSRDPLAPCVMYWPDNEPLPDPSQIRPIDSALMTYPPIINTGNKGAAEKQPGDWVCGKCNYHNWRRRKVCQTCFPYAEGNGDSISSAIQSERITLLANVLATQFNALDLDGVPPRPGVQSQVPPNSAPPHLLRFADGQSQSLGNSRNASPLLPPLPLTDHDKVVSPIYQTSGGVRQVVGSERASRAAQPYTVLSSPRESHNLLPSFLQDIVHSSSQSPSPTSSSSIDLSYDGSSEDAHYVLTPGTSSRSVLPVTASRQGFSGLNVRKNSSSSFNSLGRSGGSSIWKLDGEESKTYTSSTSTRTSPTTLHAQIASARRNVSANDPSAVVDVDNANSGITPKGTSGFWQAQTRYT